MMASSHGAAAIPSEPKSDGSSLDTVGSVGALTFGGEFWHSPPEGQRAAKHAMCAITDSYVA